MLLLTAAVWGVAFVAQSVGMDYIGPFTFNSIRSLIGGLVLIPCIWFLNREKSEAEKKTEPQNRKKLIGWRDLLWCGTGSGQFFAADGNSIHFCGKGGIYYRSLYCDCTAAGIAV